MNQQDNANKDVFIKLLTINTRGLGNNNKRKKLFTWLKYYDPDIILMQETHSIPEIEKYWSSQWPQMKFIYNHGTKSAKGVAILIHKRIDLKIINTVSIQKGRHLRLETEMQGEKVNIENLYAPNDIQEQNQFFTELNKLDRQEDQEINLIGGDFNITMNAIDRKSGVSGRQKIVDLVESLMQKNKLCDIWRFKNPKKRQYTWSREQGTNASRLDYWLISQNCVAKVKKTKILPTILTDHRSVMITYNLKQITEKGPGVWRMNDRHLDDEQYKKQVKLIVNKMKISKENAIKKWVQFKGQIRKMSRDYGRKKALVLRLETENLKANMKELEQLQEGDNESYMKLHNELEEFFGERTEKASFQNSMNWLQAGEKNTKYFYGLEKRTIPPVGINQLYTDQHNDQHKVIDAKVGN